MDIGLLLWQHYCCHSDTLAATAHVTRHNLCSVLSPAENVAKVKLGEDIIQHQYMQLWLFVCHGMTWAAVNITDKSHAAPT